MSKFGVYFKLELKRMLSTMPRLMGGMIVFAMLIVGIAAINGTIQKSQNKNFETLDVAIVGDEDDKYTQLAISTVENMETVKMAFSFNYCDEKEAEEGLAEEKYDLAFIFPEKYIDGFMHGENKKIEVRFGKGQSSIVSFVMKSLSKVAGDILVESEKNIYSMQDYYRDKKLENEKEAVLDINIGIIKAVLARANTYLIEEVDSTDGLPLGMYYFCDVIVLIFMFLGLLCSKLLQRNDVDLEKKMYVGGLSPTKQIIAKLSAFVITFSVVFAVFVSVVMLALNYVSNADFILQGQEVEQMLTNMIKTGIILLPICALTMFVYEMFNDAASGVLTLFVVVLVLGFVAGCFYPLSFLPKSVQILSNFTVTRAMFCYVSGCICNEFSMRWLIIMLIHTFIIIGMNIWVRKKKLST